MRQAVTPSGTRWRRRSAPASDQTVRVSNADRVVFPDVGLTKGDVVAYYEAVAPFMLPLLSGRPLTLQRYPKGLAGPGFMQKNAPAHYPDEIGVWEVPKSDGGTTRYPVVTTESAIPYLANQGTITFHAWTSTVDHPQEPDWLVIDLDPLEGDAESARQVALATRSILDVYHLDSLPVATGSKGYHIWVGLEPGVGYGPVARAAHALSAFIERSVPELATGEFLKKERGGRVFIDWLRNGFSSTVAVPFSLRPRPRATVAMPITWEELASTDPDAWTLRPALNRVPEAPPFPKPSALPLDEIEAAASELGIDLDTTFDRFGRTRS